MKIISPLLVIFCSILAVKSKTCLGSQEKSIISGIKSAIKTLEEKLEGKSPRFRAGWKEYKDHCYFFSSGTKPWHEAEVDCRILGGYLTQVTDSTENSWIVTMITSEQVNQQSYWMGATDFVGGDWVWMNDLSKVVYTNWTWGQPDNSNGIEDCAFFSADKNYEWSDKLCTEEIAYICESHQGSNCLPYSRQLNMKKNIKPAIIPKAARRK
ncbi:perlucin-like protein [Mytilus trossulus]|uniref:perlucin-like protein n=1 Tax=Mytilus trossulus TaxID=6551 RepID=UPI003006731D